MEQEGELRFPLVSKLFRMIPQQWVPQQIVYVTAVSLATRLLLEGSIIQNGNHLHSVSSAKEILIVSQLAATNRSSFLKVLEL